jgi:hypothetical protein
MRPTATWRLADPLSLADRGAVLAVDRHGHGACHHAAHPHNSLPAACGRPHTLPPLAGSVECLRWSSARCALLQINACCSRCVCTGQGCRRPAGRQPFDEDHGVMGEMPPQPVAGAAHPRWSPFIPPPWSSNAAHMVRRCGLRPGGDSGAGAGLCTGMAESAGPVRTSRYSPLTDAGGADVEHSIAPSEPGVTRGSSYCARSSSAFSVSAGQRDALTVLAVKGSGVRIPSAPLVHHLISDRLVRPGQAPDRRAVHALEPTSCGSGLLACGRNVVAV